MALAKVDLDSLYKVTAKGRTYYYAWRPGKGEGKAARLHSEPGSQAFIEELAEKLKARKGGQPGTLHEIIAGYRASDLWVKDISAVTRKHWSPWLDRIQERFGTEKTSDFDHPLMRKAISRWRDKFKATPRTADLALQVFSRVLKFGMLEGQLATNACTGIPRLYANDRSAIIWTDADLEALEHAASVEVWRAARLAVLTGLRQGDLLRLSWSHVGPLSIRIATGKSKGRRTAEIPLYADLKALLATIPKQSTRVLNNSYGQPWQTGFGASWQKAIDKAGVAKHFHDLRGNAATNLYRAGFSEREIALMMGWSEADVAQMIETYVKKDEILLDRIARMDEARTAAAKLSAKPSAE